MADLQFIFFTKEDIDNLPISQRVKTSIFNDIKDFNNIDIQELQILCQKLIAEIEKVMYQKNQKNSKVTYSYSFRLIRKQTFKDIMMIGGLLVFKLRQYLLQESINFSLGVVNPKGELFEKRITQDELFKKNTNTNKSSIRSSLSQHAILISRSLEKFSEDDENLTFIDYWPAVYSFAFDGPAIPPNSDGEKPIESNGYKYYQKDSKDIDVYIRYEGAKNKVKRHYYYTKDLNYFNAGWLYEWFMEFILNASEEAKEKFENQLYSSDTPLNSFMKQMDATPGYQGGDFITQGQQIQAKFYNQRMISYTSILTVLKEVENILSNLILTNIDIEEASNRFIQLFSNDTTALNYLNQSYNKIVEQQLQFLLEK